MPEVFEASHLIDPINVNVLKPLTNVLSASDDDTRTSGFLARHLAIDNNSNKQLHQIKNIARGELQWK